MKTEIRKVDEGKREISIEVSGDIVKNKFEDVFQRLNKEAKVPGFRPGHAPRDILEKRFSDVAHEQAMKELIPDVYHQAVEKEGLEVLDLPEISEVKLDRSSLSFKAKVEIRPEINLKNYKGLKINYKKVSVSSDEVKRNLDSLKESRKADNLDDNFAKALSYPSLAELEKAIERQALAQKDNLGRQEVESQVVEQLLKSVDFKVPQSLIERQLQDLTRQAKLDLTLKGIPKEKIEEEEKSLVVKLKPEAEKQVRIYLILSAIAKKENIPQDDHMPHQVMEFLFREAEWKEVV